MFHGAGKSALCIYSSFHNRATLKLATGINFNGVGARSEQRERDRDKSKMKKRTKNKREIGFFPNMYIYMYKREISIATINLEKIANERINIYSREREISF